MRISDWSSDVCSSDLHVAMQASAQAHVDSSISKTINLPEDIAFDAFQDVYLLAWNSGCKGCTTYRPNRVTGAVLAVSAPSGAAKQREASLPMERPETLPGSKLGRAHV